MVLLQLSSGRGPDECARAVALALEKIQSQAHQSGVQLEVLEAKKGRHSRCFKSVLLKLSNDGAEALAQQWQGAMLWQCSSPFRQKHKRKNWFFSGSLYRINDEKNAIFQNSDIQFKTCKASGAGGQHVNTTDSAVQATHLASGISVKVSSERSQHANKKLARLLITIKLSDLSDKNNAQEQQDRWEQHWQVERGNPDKVFTGNKFVAAH